MNNQKKKKQVDENITKNNRHPEHLIEYVAEHYNITEFITTSSGSTVKKDDYEKFVSIKKTVESTDNST